jgi:uncharacterized protein
LNVGRHFRETSQLRNMKKYILTFLCFCLTITSFSQLANGNEIIAEGTAKVKIKPDIALLMLVISKKDTSESKAIKKLNKEIDGLVKTLYKLGFTDKSIKIADFDISSSENDNNTTKTYEAKNSLNVKFGMDTKLIDAFYKEVETAKLKDLDIRFETLVSDSLEKATRHKLVQLAIEDAKQNAQNIADALKIKISGIKQVTKNRYNEYRGTTARWEIVKFTPPKIIGDTEIKYSTSFDKFQVEEVELEETISIVFEIPKKQTE